MDQDKSIYYNSLFLVFDLLDGKRHTWVIMLVCENISNMRIWYYELHCKHEWEVGTLFLWYLFPVVVVGYGLVTNFRGHSVMLKEENFSKFWMNIAVSVFIAGMKVWLKSPEMFLYVENLFSFSQYIHKLIQGKQLLHRNNSLSECTLDNWSVICFFCFCFKVWTLWPVLSSTEWISNVTSVYWKHEINANFQNDYFSKAILRIVCSITWLMSDIFKADADCIVRNCSYTALTLQPWEVTFLKIPMIEESAHWEC
jgi:hypothetical protein